MQSLAAVLVAKSETCAGRGCRGTSLISGWSKRLARRVRWTLKPPKWRSEMVEQPTSIPWSEDYSDEDEMIDFVVAASEMLEELLARPQPNYLRSRLIHLHKQSLVFLEDHWLH
jgi:hypothetical protein